MERLQKILAEAGVASRRKSEELILDGRVKVNGKTITELGFKADFSDDIRVDDKPVKKEESVVFIFNKPKNVISSCKDEKGRVTILDYFDEPYRLYPLGRLDYDSSGLLLVTNDGELTQKILHPKYEVEKLYEVKIDKIVSDEKLNKLSEGICLDGRKCAPCTIEILSKSESKKTMLLHMVLHEGRNREIRRMFESIGVNVLRLQRLKEADIELGNLKPGEYRRLKPYELSKLRKYLG